MALGAAPHLALAQSLTADGFLENRIRSTALGILEDGAGAPRRGSSAAARSRPSSVRSRAWS